jgi:hypothetical protein
MLRKIAWIDRVNGRTACGLGPLFLDAIVLGTNDERRAGLLSIPHVVRAGLGDEKIIAIDSIGVVVPRPRDA